MTVTSFKDVYNESKDEFIEIKNKFERKFAVNFTAQQFSELFLLEANKVIVRRSSNADEFIIDDLNRNVINQLYYYAIGSDKFEHDLQKGILLLGNLGSGKTIILTAFVNTLSKLSRKKYTVISAKKLIVELSKKDKDEMYCDYYADNKAPVDYRKVPLLIDDIGKERLKSVDYGTEITPMADFLAERYDNCAMTFATGNYTIETLKEHYGETITERMIEMFNIIILKGSSRRK